MYKINNMKKIYLAPILEYLNKDFIEASIESVFAPIINEQMQENYRNAFEKRRDNYYNDEDGVNEIIDELDELMLCIEEHSRPYWEDEISSVFRQSFYEGKKRYDLEDLLNAKKEILKLLNKFHKDGFFDEIFQIKALRLASLFENIESIPKEIIAKNKILKNAQDKFKINNIQQLINESNFLLLRVEGLNDLFKNIVEDSFPNSLRNINLSPEKYKEKNKIINVESKLFYNKGQELISIVKNNIKNKKNIDIIERAGIIGKINSCLLGNSYSNFDLQEYLFSNYVEEFLLLQKTDFIYNELEKYEKHKDSSRYDSIIDGLRELESNGEEKPLTDLMEYAKNLKDYKNAFKYLEINPFLNKNLKKSLINEIVKLVIQDQIILNDLDIGELSIFQLITDCYKKQEYESKRNNLLSEIANNEEQKMNLILQLETKILTIDYDKFIYLFERDYREQNLKNAIGFSFNYQFGFNIDYSKNKIQITLQYEGVSKMNNNELLLDSVEIIELILNKQESESHFNKMKLKSKINLSQKEECERSARKKI